MLWLVYAREGRWPRGRYVNGRFSSLCRSVVVVARSLRRWPYTCSRSSSGSRIKPMGCEVVGEGIISSKSVENPIALSDDTMFWTLRVIATSSRLKLVDCLTVKTDLPHAVDDSKTPSEGLTFWISRVIVASALCEVSIESHSVDGLASPVRIVEVEVEVGSLILFEGCDDSKLMSKGGNQAWSAALGGYEAGQFVSVQ
jgi:hypothetical protein